MASQQIMKQKGFSLNWERASVESTTLSKGYFSLRDWQIQAFDLLHKNSHMILNAPMGSGKSWLMCALSAFKLKRNKSLRCILAVPQTIIAPGFINAKLQLPDGEKIDWHVENNLCDTRASRGAVNYLFNWIKAKPSNNMNDRVIICTHATLVALQSKLKACNCVHLLDNLLLWVDEAHHVRNTAVAEFSGSVISNSIGEIVATLLNKPFANVQLGLTTASFFRGDRCTLLTEDMEQKFSRFNLPYDEYLKSMNNLESLSYNFLICGPDYSKAIESIAQERKGKDIIYVPHPVSKSSTGDKYKETDNIIERYENIHGKRKNQEDGAILTLKRDGNEFKILDLVDEVSRRHKKSCINGKWFNEDRDFLDVIISLGMFKEGANWIWADRSVIVGTRSSLVDVIQMVGRLFRDADGKRHVEVIHLLPFSLDQKDENSFRENLNNYLKMIYASLILENILKPIKIKIPLANKKKREAEYEKKSDNWLSALVPDDSRQMDLKQEVYEQIINVLALKKEKRIDGGISWNEFEELIPHILEKYEVHEYQQELSKQLWVMMHRADFRMQGTSVEDIDYNALQDAQLTLSGFLRYTSGACNIDTFQKLRDAIQMSRAPLSIELIIDWLRQYMNKYNKKPRMQSGIIEFAIGPYENITWSAINAALWKGGRGLPGGSSLANLIEEQFGIRNKMNLPGLTEAIIHEWIEQFIKKYHRKPIASDGTVEFANGRYTGETWGAIDSSLLAGVRGLIGGSSLAQFIEQNFSIRSYCKPPELSLEQIKDWIQQHISKYDKKPTAKSGVVEFAEGEYKGTSWATIAHAMRNGVRGLVKGLSLAEFIKNVFNISNHYACKPLTVDIIYNWISQFIDKHDRKPTQNDGIIEFAKDEYKEMTWSTLNSHLWKGGRGLSGGSSLSQFIKTHFGIKNCNCPPMLNPELINKWISAYIKRYKKKPAKTSGEVEFAEGEYAEITWGAIDCAFKAGKRGLPKTTLAQYIQKEFKIRSAGNVAFLPEELIIKWVQKYLDEYGIKPKAISEIVKYANGDHIGITWLAIDASLHRGTHGLPGGSSLAQFIKKKFEI